MARPSELAFAAGAAQVKRDAFKRLMEGKPQEPGDVSALSGILKDLERSLEYWEKRMHRGR